VAGILLEEYAARFSNNTPDDEWIEAVARHGSIALTHDGRMRCKPNEQRSVRHDA